MGFIELFESGFDGGCYWMLTGGLFLSCKDQPFLESNISACLVYFMLYSWTIFNGIYFFSPILILVWECCWWMSLWSLLVVLCPALWPLLLFHACSAWTRVGQEQAGPWIPLSRWGIACGIRFPCAAGSGSNFSVTSVHCATEIELHRVYRAVWD